MKIKDVLALTPKLGDGALLTPQPSLEAIVREYYQRLVGPGGQSDVLADAYISRIVELAAAGTAAAPQPEPEAPRAAQEQRRHEAAAEPTPEAAPGSAQRPGEAHPMRDPLDVLGRIGLDLKVGGVDVVGGLKRGAEGGSILPLATGLMGVVLAAVASSEANRAK